MYAPTRELQVLIVYYSRFGALKLLAERIAEGARSVAGVQARLLEVEDRPIEELRPGEDEHAMALRRAVVVSQLTCADALIVGAPSYFGSMASPLKRLFEDCVTASNPPVTDRSRPWRHQLFRHKVSAAFTGSGTPHGGNEQTLHSILTMLMHLGMIVVTPGQREPILENVSSPYGPTAITGPDGSQLPSVIGQEEGRTLGQQVAEVATWLDWGRTEWEKWRGQQQLAMASTPGLALAAVPRPRAASEPRATRTSRQRSARVVRGFDPSA
jgi:NAD(P)H dehydrogenase (quinone)